MPSDLYTLISKHTEREQNYTIRIRPSLLDKSRLLGYAHERPLNWIISHAVWLYTKEYQQDIKDQIARMEKMAQDDPKIAEELKELKQTLRFDDE